MRAMYPAGWWIALLASVEAGGSLRADPDKESNEAKIALLIRDLGHDLYPRREAACKLLVQIGEPALPALRKNIEEPASLEARKRGTRVAKDIMLACRKTKKLGLELALIEPGEFVMGAMQHELGNRGDETQHRVRISRHFLMGVYELSQGEFAKLMEFNPSWFSKGGEGSISVRDKNTDRFPVEQVTWFDAVEFCNRLSKFEGYPEYYKITDVFRIGKSINRARVTIAGGNGFRLPTEAEWEYACRAGSRTSFHFGGSNSGREANLKPGGSVGYGSAPTWDPLNRTTYVGSYKPNHFGLYDMHGNVAEWCGDWYDRDYYAASPENDPPGPETGRHKVSRGGAWLFGERLCRSASRYWHTPETLKYYQGFRVARTP